MFLKELRFYSMNEQTARSLRNKLATAVGVLAIGGYGAGLYVLERDGDAFSMDMQDLKREVSELKVVYNEKQRACAVLEAVILTREHAHSYYKPLLESPGNGRTRTDME